MTIGDFITKAVIMTVGLLIAATGMVGRMDGEYTFSTRCAAEWCANDRSNDYLTAEGKQMIADQLATHSCDTKRRLADRVAILKSEKAGRAEAATGTYTGDLGVVRVVSFDEAWKLAKQGDAWVVGYCG